MDAIEIARPTRSDAAAPDRRLDLMKVFAVIAMTCDHVDTFIFSDRLGLSSTVGRLAMPLFVFALAYNLICRPHQRTGQRPGSELRAIRRMLFWGLVACTPYILLTQRWIPLNIMFSLALCTASVWILRASVRPLMDLPFEKRLFLSIPAVLLVTALGTIIEYHWWLVVLFAASCFWCKRPGWIAGSALLLSLVSLYPFHGSFWPVIAFPMMMLLTASKRPLEGLSLGSLPVHMRSEDQGTLQELPKDPAPDAPRLSRIFRTHGFHAYYSLHLCLILILRDSII